MQSDPLPPRNTILFGQTLDDSVSKPQPIILFFFHLILLLLLALQGGIKAEVWADTIQLGIMAVGLVILIIRASIMLGGMGIVIERAQQGGRMEFTK